MDGNIAEPASGRRTAFILGGGASRGAYQVGCLKRLEEEGISPELIIGSSIGVLNSLLWVTGGADHAWSFWSKALSLPRLLDLSLRKNLLTSNAFFSMDRFVRYVEPEIDFDKCFHSETELTYICTNLTEGHEQLLGNRTATDAEQFQTITRIGYTVPILHPLIEYEGGLWADGGFIWNVPFEYAEDWQATDIYILSVVPSHLPREENLRFIHQVALRMYDIFWRTFGNSSYLEKHLEGGKYHDINVTVVEPSTDTGLFDPIKMLNAHPGKSKKLMWEGYHDTEKVLRGEKPPLSGRARGGERKLP